MRRAISNRWRYFFRLFSTWRSSSQAAAEAVRTGIGTCGAQVFLNRVSDAISDGDPATKPERKPGALERFESEWNESSRSRPPVEWYRTSSAPTGAIVS